MDGVPLRKLILCRCGMYRRTTTNRITTVMTKKKIMRMIKRMNIGFEFQTPYMSFCNVEDGVLKQTMEFDSFEETNQKSPDSNIIIYGDTTTDKAWYVATYRKIQAWRNAYSELRVESGGKKYSIYLDNNIQYMLNDMECVRTHFTRRDVALGMEGIKDFILTQCRLALTGIVRFLGRRPDNPILSVYGIHRTRQQQQSPDGSNRRTRRKTTSIVNRKDFPYDRVISIGGTHAILVKDIHPVRWEEVPFYIQCTIGVPLIHAVKVMRLLEQDIGEISGELESDVRMTDIAEDLAKIRGFRTKPVVIKAILSLFVYSFRTSEKRKASLFIIRHLFTDLLKMMDNRAFDVFSEILHHYDDGLAADARVLYYQVMIPYSKDMSPETKTRRRSLKRLQSIDTTSTFNIEDHGKDTMILIEVRHTNALLNMWLKRKQSLLTLVDLSTAA